MTLELGMAHHQKQRDGKAQSAPYPSAMEDEASSHRERPLKVPARTAEAFSFPYATPYKIQLDLMAALFEAIESRKVAVFESPTGTGKSLSLICGAFTWLRLHQQRTAQSWHDPVDAGSLSAEKAGDEPDWVIKQARERERRAQQRGEDELRERIRAVKRKELELRRTAVAERSRSFMDGSRGKRQKLDLELEDSTEKDEDVEFLPSTTVTNASAPSWHSRAQFASQETSANEDDNLSPAVRALMAQFSSSTSGPAEDDELPETMPKIIYTSRTHSQLSQFVAELRKTAFARDLQITEVTQNSVGTPEEDVSTSVRVIALGSRKQMCINADVQKVGKKAGTEAMNEACRDLISNAKGKKRCEMLPTLDEAGRVQALDFRDRAMASVRDIEDLVDLGKDMKVCPYYAARTSARQAELVTMPYNLLLQANARESLGISLKDSVVLVDEAHNLIDTILAVHTCQIASTQLTMAKGQINEYLRRFGGRLRGDSEMMLRTLRRLLEGLERTCIRWAEDKSGSKSEEVWTAAMVIDAMGGNSDTVNMARLERFLKDTNIARKVSGYAEKVALSNREVAARKQVGRRDVAKVQVGSVAPMSSSAIGAMHTIESFILSLSNRIADGRVLLAKDTDEAGTTVVRLKYQLLNPSESFSEIVSQARSVILAGGTMEPISDVRQQLVPSLANHRWSTFSCGHIVPKENFFCTVVPSGPRGVPFEFRFDKRGDTAVLDDLGNCLVNIVALVPHGVVVFLPSYRFLGDVAARWKATGLWQRLQTRKGIFLEPQSSNEVDEVLKAYAAGIDTAASQPASSVSGSLLLAVVGAKLSEGINFSDRMARAVVMVGLPFPNSQSPELIERMRHVRELANRNVAVTSQFTAARGTDKKTPDPGQELYVNMCMKAVNQSIGRAIRHQNDFAALILLDARYGRQDIRNRLPGWIRSETTVQPNFGGLMKNLGAWFREKRAKGAL